MSTRIFIDEATGQRFKFAEMDSMLPAPVVEIPVVETPPVEPAPTTPKKSRRGKPHGKNNETDASKAARIAAFEAGTQQPDAIILQEDGTTKLHSEIQAEKAAAGGFKRGSSKKQDEKFVPLCDPRCKGTCVYTAKKTGETNTYVVWSRNADGSVFLRPIASSGHCFGGFPVAKGVVKDVRVADATEAAKYGVSHVDMTQLCGCYSCKPGKKQAA